MLAVAYTFLSSPEFLLSRGISTEILPLGEAPEQTNLWGENRVRNSVRQPITSLGVLILSLFPVFPPESSLPCLSLS